MNGFNIFISPDIANNLQPQIELLGYNCVTDENDNDIRLAIIVSSNKNIELAIKFSRSLFIDVILVKKDLSDQLSKEEYQLVNPLAILAMPLTTIELEINLNRFISEIIDRNIFCKDTKIWAKGILNTIKDAVITIDAEGKIKMMNPAAQHLAGIEEIKAVGNLVDRVLQLKSPDEQPISLSNFSGDEESEAFEGQLLNRISKDCVQVSGNIMIIRDGEDTFCGRVITLRDVGEIKSLFTKINYQSSHDNLTGTLNRESFINLADKLISEAKYDDTNHGLVIISLDKFKAINDTCGHKAGDELLRKIAYFIKDIDIHDQYTIGRIGGDEFGVLLKNRSLAEIKHFTKSIKRKISKQDFIWGDKEYQIMSSFGIVTITKSTIDHYELFAAADDTTAIAKEKGGSRIEIYNNGGIEYNRRRGEMLWIHKIKGAINKEQFKLYYQDIQSVSKSDIKKIEILVRIKNEAGDIISPTDFIPSAEHYGLMSDIDRIVIEKSIAACRDIIDNKNIKETYMLSVNISGTSIPDKSLPGFIQSTFQKYKVPPTLFCFEITETSAITNMNLAESFINNLKRIGCKFSLDDFGSGFSNFTYLRDLDVDFLKIDGSFISDMIDEPINKAMVESINNIGHIMNMKTVAEYVKNEEIKQELIDIGVDYLQGYAINRPTPIEKLLL